VTTETYAVRVVAAPDGVERWNGSDFNLEYFELEALQLNNTERAFKTEYEGKFLLVHKLLNKPPRLRDRAGPTGLERPMDDCEFWDARRNASTLGWAGGLGVLPRLDSSQYGPGCFQRSQRLDENTVRVFRDTYEELPDYDRECVFHAGKARRTIFDWRSGDPWWAFMIVFDLERDDQVDPFDPSLRVRAEGYLVRPGQKPPPLPPVKSSG
jgi:hypothetical protein